MFKLTDKASGRFFTENHDWSLNERDDAPMIFRSKIQAENYVREYFIHAAEARRGMKIVKANL